MRSGFLLSAGSVALLLASACGAADGPGKCPPYADGRKFDAAPIVDAIDKDKDGRMTHAEWAAAEAPEPSWNFFMAKETIKAQGYITRADFLAESPPNGIDTNCDGRITIEEFLATKKWQMGGPPPGGPGGPPGAGGPPPGSPAGPPPAQAPK
ncbi:MAG: hypothetical protein U1F30_07230 [Steroidobacteraceae bacterium]